MLEQKLGVAKLWVHFKYLILFWDDLTSSTFLSCEVGVALLPHTPTVRIVREIKDKGPYLLLVLSKVLAPIY